MAPGPCAWRSPCVNPPADLIGEQNELAGQGPVQGFNAGSDKAPTKSSIPPEASTPSLVLFSTKDLFTKFIKMFMETTQAQALAEPREWPFKARSPETYSGKSHMDCYHFCQQCEDHFKTSGTTGMNCTLFAASFLRGTISLRWAQHKCRHQSATPIMWSKFKTFLRKDLGNSQAFIDNIWSKFRRDSQYQLEETRDWASHFQHLQFILAEFDTVGAPNESTIICYFWEGLKPSIKVEMEQQDRASTSFKEMVQRAINEEAKADLRLSIMVRDTDSRCPRGHCPSQNTSTKVQTQGSIVKKSKPKEFRPKDLKLANEKTSAPLCTEESRKTSRQDKKKGYLRKKRDQKNSTPATENNTIEGEKK